MSRGDVQDSDKRLNELLRQENLPTELASKYPNIAELIGAKNIGQNDMDVMSAMGKKLTAGIGNTSTGSIYPGGFKHIAEDEAADAYAKDIAHTEKPEELLNYMYNKDKSDYNVAVSPEVTKHLKDNQQYGAFNQNNNVMLLDPTLPLKTQLNTIMHEHQHAKDANMSLPIKANDERVKQREEQFDVSPVLRDAMIGGGDLDNASKIVAAKHFNEPGSAVLNEFLRANKQIGKESGVVPHYEDQYQDIRKLLNRK